MKKTLSVLLCTIIFALSFSAMFATSVSAKSCKISVSSQKVQVGENFEVSLICSPKTDIFSVTTELTFDTDMVSYVSGGYLADDSLVTIQDKNTGAVERTYVITFRALAEGSAKFSVEMIAEKPDHTEGYSSASTSVSITKNTSAPISKIDSISVSNGTMMPSFVNAITDYSVVVPYIIDKITVDAQCEDQATTVSGTGEMKLKVGNNKAKVTATENNKNVEYNISIRRLSEAESVEYETKKLSELELQISDETYHVVRSLTNIEIPNNYSITTTIYNDVEINVITDQKSKYTLFYLTDETQTKSYWCSLSSSGKLSKLDYFIASGVMYIFEPVKMYAKNGNNWYTTKLKLDDATTINAYKSTDSRLNDIYVVYCYVDGENGYYRYDTSLKTMQRAPDFVVSSEEEKSDKKPSNFFSYFNSLSNSGKIMISLGVIEVIGLLLIGIILTKNAIDKYKENKALEAEEEAEAALEEEYEE